jgi:probable F420-dependent oxidoreductase
MPDLRWGLTLPFPGTSLADHLPLFQQAEAAGYDDLWTGETTGPDGFTPLALAAAVTDRVRLGTGVVNPYTRGPAVLAQTAAALQDASRGRFVLGIGSSSNVIVERWNGVPFVKPLSAVRDAVDGLRPLLTPSDPPGRGAGGFKLETPPETAVPIVIAALRDKMLRMAAAHGDGAFTNFLPLGGARHVVEQVRAGEAEAGKAAGSVEVVCRFFCIPLPEEEALPLARFMFAAYGTVPVYTEFFRSLGWAEQLDPMVEAWQAGDRKLALERSPDDLIREIFVIGSPEQQHEQLGRFAEAGITTFVLTPITDPAKLPATIDALARR